MKHIFLFTALLLFSFPPAKAQQGEFAPAGAEWFYSYQSSWTPFKGFFHAQNVGDTLIDGRSCKKICTSYYLQPTTPPYCDAISSSRYIFQQADSIFEYNSYSGPQLLFRNNYQLGDSVYVYHLASVVSKIDTLMFNNQPVRRFQLTDTRGLQTIYYDRFGPAEGLFDFSWGIVVDGPTFRLRCYQDDGFPQANVSGEACDLVLNAQEPLYELLILPNPAHDFIDLQVEGYRKTGLHLRIWDAAGRLVQDRRSVSITEPVDVRSLPPGFYMLAVQADGVIVQQKFIKN